MAPYLAHAPMEPLNCVIELTDAGGSDLGRLAIPETVEQAVVAGILGLRPQDVRIHTAVGLGAPLAVAPRRTPIISRRRRQF